MFDEVNSCSARLNPWSGNDERNMNTFVVQKLLASSVADAVIRHEQDDRVFEFTFVLQPLDNLANKAVGVSTAIQIRRPIGQQHGIVGIVWWQRDFADGRG